MKTSLSRTILLQEIRKMRFEEAYEGWQERRLTQEDAADVPVIISALRAGSFELAGEIAAGAVTWVCPAPYLRDVAMLALVCGAASGGRARPKLIAHAFLTLTTDAGELSRGIAEFLTHYPNLRNYQEMFVAAGMPEAREGKWSPAMIDAVVLHGDPAACERKVRCAARWSGSADYPRDENRRLAVRPACEIAGSAVRPTVPTWFPRAHPDDLSIQLQTGPMLTRARLGATLFRQLRILGE